MMALLAFTIENMNRLRWSVGTVLCPIIGEPPIIEAAVRVATVLERMHGRHPVLHRVRHADLAVDEAAAGVATGELPVGAVTCESDSLVRSIVPPAKP